MSVSTPFTNQDAQSRSGGHVVVASASRRRAQRDPKSGWRGLLSGGPTQLQGWPGLVAIPAAMAAAAQPDSVRLALTVAITPLAVIQGFASYRLRDLPVTDQSDAAATRPAADTVVAKSCALSDGIAGASVLGYLLVPEDWECLRLAAGMIAGAYTALALVVVGRLSALKVVIERGAAGTAGTGVGNALPRRLAAVHHDRRPSVGHSFVRALVVHAQAASFPCLAVWPGSNDSTPAWALALMIAAALTFSIPVMHPLRRGRHDIVARTVMRGPAGV